MRCIVKWLLKDIERKLDYIMASLDDLNAAIAANSAAIKANENATNKYIADVNTLIEQLKAANVAPDFQAQIDALAASKADVDTTASALSNADSQVAPAVPPAPVNP